MNGLAIASSSGLPAAQPFASRRSRIAWLLLFLALFGLIYNVSFQINASLTSGRLAVLGLLLVVWAQGRPAWRLADARVLLLFIPLPYVLVQCVFTHDYGQFSRFFHLALYAYLGGSIVARLAGDLEALLRLVLAVVSFQALLLFFSFVSLDYRAWVDGVLISGNNFDFDNLYRAPGFTSTGGSALSVVQSLGVLAGGWLLWLRRAGGPLTGSRGGQVLATYGTLLLMLLCLASCVVVGRTGLVMSGVFFALFVAASRTTRKALTLLGVLVVPAGLVAWPWLQSLLPQDLALEYFAQWAFGFLVSGSDASVTDVQAMPIPPLRLETLLGTGLVSVTDAGNPSGHDSGLVQTYYSLGLVMAGVFFAAYAVVLLRTLHSLPRFLRWPLAALFLLIEAKEPFVFKYATMTVLIAIHTAAALPRRRQHGVGAGVSKEG